ncbi:MAG TPA: hypothetical protein VFO10_16125 [Oligoflexus sp.]|uniref:hypothetical protein n=1 Tax=Oligoflexus sp. TaxID=1971216 RepID=UPI002D7EC9A1|nr:hypothetical protein [Oligoflexus sp.]HET9238787.1 hypothetical protein [Oligoflexus sp.]
MDQLRAQLGNYLEWLESRGLTGPMAFRAPDELPNHNEPQHGDTDVPVAPVAPAASAAPVASASAAPVATSAPAPSVAEAPAPQREAGMPWKVGFYSSSDLTEEEFIMVSKIALALGLPAEDFKIWAEDSLVHVPVDLLRCSYIVALGPGSGQTLLALGQTVAMNTIQKALQGAPLLTIPHPRAMLKEPALKGGAWTALQKLKAMMLP